MGAIIKIYLCVHEQKLSEISSFSISIFYEPVYKYPTGSKRRILT